jgi:nucleoside-diphosphate-sugar epimerase
MRALVTGATGFVGAALCPVLAQHGYAVRAARRALVPAAGRALDEVAVGDVGLDTDWSAALQDVQAVVHLAARVHVMRETATDPLAEFRRANVVATARLAREAAVAGVRRFVYVSSIKVNGERTVGSAFTADGVPHPEDAYAQSKLEAEQVLREIGERTGLEIVIVRPPLVYGPGVKGNFLSLLRWVDRGLPLPLGRCDNRRSLVGITNLVDLLASCVVHPAAAGRVFLAADGEDLSTPELVRRLARVLDRRARLVPVPQSWLRVAASMLGRAGMYERLCGSLQVDIRDARQVLGWAPVLTVDEELARTADWFRQRERAA